MVDRDKFRDAMAHLPAAVNILTSDGPGGRAGLTATAVSSVTDSPGTLLVCINRKGRAHDIFLKNGVFCVNTLASNQQPIADAFAREPDMEKRFSLAAWHQLVTGAPALEDAAITFDCKISAVSEVGTHSVIFGEVLAVALASISTGLLYYGRAYHAVALA
jgi:flavin reductase